MSGIPHLDEQLPKTLGGIFFFHQRSVQERRKELPTTYMPGQMLDAEAEESAAFVKIDSSKSPKVC